MKMRNAFSVLVLCTSAFMFGKLSQSELIERRKESVNDWKTILAALRKDGLSEKNRAYRRVQTILKRSESRLHHLQQGDSHMPFSSKNVETGRGILEQLGLLGTKESEAKPVRTQASTTAQPRPKAKKTTKKPSKERKSAKRKNATKKSSLKKTGRKTNVAA